MKYRWICNVLIFNESPPLVKQFLKSWRLSLSLVNQFLKSWSSSSSTWKETRRQGMFKRSGSLPVEKSPFCILMIHWCTRGRVWVPTDGLATSVSTHNNVNVCPTRTEKVVCWVLPTLVLVCIVRLI